MPITFSCIGCGRCCHDLRLPLSVAEAIDWIVRGGEVEILCDALPDMAASGASAYADVQARHRAERAVPGISGALPLAVSITLVAAFSGACPHLLPDMRCGAYHERPDACRIYPAELRPGLALVPAAKACPPETWNADRPVFADEAGVRDPETAAAIARARAAGPADVPAKARLAALLGLDRAALVNEGLVVWRIPPAALLAALRAALIAPLRADTAAGTGADPAPAGRWTIVAQRPTTLAMIADAEAEGAAPATLPPAATYLAVA